MERTLDSKDGLRELIEMRNNKRNSINSNKILPASRNESQQNAATNRLMEVSDKQEANTEEDEPSIKQQQAGQQSSQEGVEQDHSDEKDPSNELHRNNNGSSCNQDSSPSLKSVQQQVSITNVQNNILDGRRSLRKGSGSARGSYWSTMRALSNDENKCFGPFSTGGNSVIQDEIREINTNDNNDESEDPDNNEGWGQRDVKEENLNDCFAKTNGGHARKLTSNMPGSLIDRTRKNLITHTNQTDSDVNDSPKLSKLTSNDENELSQEHMTSDQDEHYDDTYDEVNYDDPQLQDMSDNNPAPPDDSEVPMNTDDNLSEQNEPILDPNVWILPADKNICTLEEIRRGQVINKVAPNECPVLGCGKKINEMRAEPPAGTIASGLRTHVLFVHYANRKGNKKRKTLGWSTKRRSQPTPKKQGLMSTHLSPSTSRQDINFDQHQPATSSLSLIQKMSRSSPPTTGPGSLLNKKVQQIAAKSQQQSLTMSSLQSLIQATGGPKINTQTAKAKSQDTNVQKKYNQTTSSLFSILAGLTQQQQLNPQPQSNVSRNVKTAQGTNTINISQCSKNQVYNNTNPSNNRQVNSSLLSLLNEKISGNVANSLQTQLKRSLGSDSRNKIPNSRQNTQSQAVASTLANSYFPQTGTNEPSNFNSNTSILGGLCSGTVDSQRSAYDSSMSLNSFIESIAFKTGSNIGPAGIAEIKKIIEKFTSSLICSSQTIADHYLAPYVDDMPQTKPEISASDVMLAYKMMHKSHGQ